MTSVLAIDQSATSTRAVVFNHLGEVEAISQREHRQVSPQPGWVEYDPQEIWANVHIVVDEALAEAGIDANEIEAAGITNQRETTIVWDKSTGEPIYNAIAWQDTRSQALVDRLARGAGGGLDYAQFHHIVGEQLSTYASISKIMWILENVPEAHEKAEAGELCFGNLDSWLIWNLTGGPHGGVHITDATNASRTMLMDIRTLKWSDDICAAAGIPRQILPQIRSSAEVYGFGGGHGPLAGVPIAAALGDQQAAAFGQACFTPGMVKNTYGTGCFIMANTGAEPQFSQRGLVTTVAYHISGRKPVYALEGSVAVAGALVQWLRDNLGVINTSSDVENLAEQVEDADGIYFVPASSGLLAPYWCPNVRGSIVGLTCAHNKSHIARAVLEATAFQTRDVLEVMQADMGITFAELRVDGAMTANSLLMQFQSDVLAIPVVRSTAAETSALGAAYAAGIAVGFWDSEAQVAENWEQARRWIPTMPLAERTARIAGWQQAVQRTFS